MLGEPILRLDSTDSTNRVALEWDDAPHGACVVARMQTAGRGRLGRKWESAPDQGLYLSLILRDRVHGTAPYSLLSALGVAHATQKMTGLSCRVKWPNDVLALSSHQEARKIGGILGEATGGNKLVIGIGLNVNQNREELPQRPIFPASSLSLECGRGWEIEILLHAILRELNTLYTRFEAGEWGELRGEFESFCLGIGEVVNVRIGETRLVGVFEAVESGGAMILRTADGLKRVVAGDVNYF